MTLCLDGDRAGLEATQKLSGLLQEMGLSVFATRMPDDKDANLVLRESGGDALLELVRQRKPVGPPSVTPQKTEPSSDGFYPGDG